MVLCCFAALCYAGEGVLLDGIEWNAMRKTKEDAGGTYALPSQDACGLISRFTPVAEPCLGLLRPFALPERDSISYLPSLSPREPWPFRPSFLETRLRPWEDIAPSPPKHSKKAKAKNRQNKKERRNRRGRGERRSGKSQREKREGRKGGEGEIKPSTRAQRAHRPGGRGAPRC